MVDLVFFLVLVPERTWCLDWLAFQAVNSHSMWTFHFDCLRHMCISPGLSLLLNPIWLEYPIQLNWCDSMQAVVFRLWTCQMKYVSMNIENRQRKSKGASFISKNQQQQINLPADHRGGHANCDAFKSSDRFNGQRLIYRPAYDNRWRTIVQWTNR